MPGIKPECRSRHLTARCIRRQAGRPLGRARGQYAALLPMREWCPAGVPGNPARHVCRTRGRRMGPAGEGIMIEVIFAGGNDPAQTRHLSPQDLATILADSVVLLQTPAAGRAAEVGLS